MSPSPSLIVGAVAADLRHEKNKDLLDRLSDHRQSYMQYAQSHIEKAEQPPLPEGWSLEYMGYRAFLNEGNRRFSVVYPSWRGERPVLLFSRPGKAAEVVTPPPAVVRYVEHAFRSHLRSTLPVPAR